MVKTLIIIMKKLLAYIFAAASALVIAVGFELPLPTVPPTLRTVADRADYVALHFWDAMDFADSSATDAAFMAQNVANFISVFPLVSTDSVRALAAADAVARARATDESALAFSQAVENCLFDSESEQRDEALYVLFLGKMLDAAYPDSVRSQWMLDMASRNLPGSRVPDFDITDRNGEVRSLHSLLGKTTILYFYDPGCDDCHAAAELMAADPVLRLRLDAGSAAVVAVHPGDLDEWKTTRGTFPTSWIDGCDDGAIDDASLFLFASYPSFYLLAPDGTIILKDAPVQTILRNL